MATRGLPQPRLPVTTNNFDILSSFNLNVFYKDSPILAEHKSQTYISSSSGGVGHFYIHVYIKNISRKLLHSTGEKVIYCIQNNPKFISGSYGTLQVKLKKQPRKFKYHVNTRYHRTRRPIGLGNNSTSRCSLSLRRWTILYHKIRLMAYSFRNHRFKFPVLKLIQWTSSPLPQL